MEYQRQRTGSPDAEPLPSRFENVPPAFKSFASKKKTKKTKKLPTYCVFCKNNNESEAVYTSHVLKDPEGKVVCPALYVYVCPICNNTGHKAHTVKHCPYNPDSLRKQTELAEIWKAYRSPKPQSPPLPELQYSRPQPLMGSSQHNTRLGSSSSPTFFFNNCSSSSSSPLMSPNSSGYFSHTSSPTYSCYSSPVRQQQQVQQQSVHQHQQQQHQQLQTNESIVYENLIKLLQYSS